MAQYTINYLDGDSETITADHMSIDYEAKAYVFRLGAHDGDMEAVIPSSLVPTANVRSIHRDDTTVTG